MLSASGSSNGSAFALISPEAYASASQIGTANALVIGKALRTADDITMRSMHGLFTFVAGVGGWRQLNGDAGFGTSRANVNSGGILGGVGVGTEVGSIAAFGGYLDSRQSIAALGAHTTAGGVVAGLTGKLAFSGLRMSATLAYDGSDADTTRTVPRGTASAQYQLHSFVADVQASYALPVGLVVVTPELGFTHVETWRGAASESGGDAFALKLAAQHDAADFVDAELRLDRARTAAFQPWAAAGLRHQFDGRGRTALAALVDTTMSFTVSGVATQATLATASAGFNWRLASSLFIDGSYRGEFGNSETGHSATVGIRYAF